MSSGEPLVLTVDLGSGGPKIGYTTVRGETKWWHYERGDVVGGATVQDADDWWNLVVTQARAGLESPDVDAADVVGVAITGQWASTVPVDESGRPVSECLMWSDTRGGEYSQELFAGPFAGYSAGTLWAWLRRSGGVPNTTGADPIAHMLHIEHDRPEIKAAARWYLEPVDQLTMRFTGVAAASPMSMTGAWLTDNRDLGKVAYDEVLVKRSGVDATKLPPLVASGTIIGKILPEVADQIGLPHDVEVITGAPDLHIAAVSSGCIEPYRAHISMGTSSWISCPIPMKKTDAIRQMASVPGFGDGQYLLANNQDNAGRALEWYRSWIAPDMPYEDLIAEAGEVPAGAGGVVFTPWLTGERSPIDDGWARAGFQNMSLETSRAELTRAVLEGVALNMRWLAEAADVFTKRKLDTVRLLGGGARIDLWCQILADVTGRELQRVEDPLIGGLRGAAIFFGMNTGHVAAEEVHELVPVDKVFTPDPANRAVHDKQFKQFPKLYSQNRKIFAALNKPN